MEKLEYIKKFGRNPKCDRDRIKVQREKRKIKVQRKKKKGK